MNGVLVVAVVGPLLIALVSVADLVVLQLTRKQASPGEFIHDWARNHPYLAALIAGFVAAFAAHIFWYTLASY